jgi:serine protease inhibitor
MNVSQKTQKTVSIVEKDSNAYTNSNNDFESRALTTYKERYAKSFVFSPYSIMSVLTMFYVGTSGSTEKEFKQELKMEDRSQMIYDLKKIF